MSTIKKRIEEFALQKGITISEFERSCGFSHRMIKGGGENIGSDKLEKIISIYPEINLYWLVTGKGEMEISPPGDFSESNDALTKYLTQRVQTLENEVRLLTNQNGKLQAKLEMYETSNSSSKAI